jgi:hypothetical protein
MTLSDLISWIAFFLLATACWNLMWMAAPPVVRWLNRQKWVHWLASKLP